MCFECSHLAFVDCLILGELCCEDQGMKSKSFYMLALPSDR